MCILSDGDIRAALGSDALRVEPFVDENLTPNGLDLTVEEVYLKSEDVHVRDGVARIPPGGWFAVATREVVTLGPQVAAQLWIRSSYARRGMVGVFGKVEAGFSGSLTVAAANLGPEPLEVPVGDRFCQIVFEKMHSVPEQLYHERSGNYQDQRGVTLAPVVDARGDGPAPDGGD